jgi:hypothetical protein
VRSVSAAGLEKRLAVTLAELADLEAQAQDAEAAADRCDARAPRRLAALGRAINTVRWRIESLELALAPNPDYRRVP